MERRKFAREFKLEAVRLIRDRGFIVYASVAGPRAHIAAALLGGEVLRRSAAYLSRQRPDEARAARDRTAQALSGEAEGGTGHTKKAVAYFAKETKTYRTRDEARADVFDYIACTTPNAGTRRSVI